MNPFPYQTPITGRAFCDREDVLDALIQAGRTGRGVAVAGTAGHGLSSLALEAAARLQAAGMETLLLRLEGLADADELGERLPPEVSGSGSARRVLLVDDADALASGGPAPDARAHIEEAAGGGPTLLFGHDPDALGRLLEEGGPVLEAGPLPLAAWLPHALERFLETDVWVANHHVEAAHRLVGGHPRHLQHLSHEIWELACDGGRRVEDGMVEDAMTRIVSGEARVWTHLWQALTANQRRFLRGVARAGSEPHPFGRAFLESAGLSTASSAQRAASSLRGLGLVAEADGGLRVADPLLRRWLVGSGAGPTSAQRTGA
jgi:hypothetical protein